MKKPVFVSFDFDHDRVLKDFILGQAKLQDSPFSSRATIWWPVRDTL